jgi:hypothetical protein
MINFMISSSVEVEEHPHPHPHHILQHVDIDNKPFDADAIWRYTLKRFADPARAQARQSPHNTTQLLSISHQ